MSDTIKSFLGILSVPVGLVLSFCYMMLSLIVVPFPLNYAAASVPFWIVFFYWLKEMRRRQRLGFAHDRVREIPEERMSLAFEEIEKQRRKSKSL